MQASNLTLVGGNLEFADGDGGEKGVTPVELVVRTNSPVSGWMGDIIHDHSGMFSKDKIPLDWVHGSDNKEILGYLDKSKTQVSNEEIRCFGQVISVEPNDIADRVVKQMKAGIPFESSISFGGQGLEMEEVEKGDEVTVNGAKFEGPGYVVTKWPLRGVAICPHGADNRTSASLALGEEEISVLILSNKEFDMTDTDVLSPEQLKVKEE